MPLKRRSAEQGQVVIAAPACDINLWLGNERNDSGNGTGTVRWR
ncbi:hypothetical protein [Enterocloster sp.]